MRIYRLQDPVSSEPVWAVREDEHHRRIHADLAGVFEQLRRGEPLEFGPPFVVDERALLAPATPSKVVCVGLNYEHHAREMKKTIPEEPLLFLKPPTAVIGPDQAIVLPVQSEEVHHEGELAMIVGRRAHQIAPEDFHDHILGYCCANDVTARDIQRREKRYTRSKGFDTFCPLGPCIVTADAFEPSEHRVTCRVDGEVRQQSSLDDFIFDLPLVVSFISHVMTLEVGDVILTGTPAGVGPLRRSQRVEVEIDGIGTLRNPVA